MTRTALFTIFGLLLVSDSLAAPRLVALGLVAPGIATTHRFKAQAAMHAALPSGGGLRVDLKQRCGPPFDGACFARVAKSWGAQRVVGAWVERAEGTCALSLVLADAGGGILESATELVACDGSDLVAKITQLARFGQEGEQTPALSDRGGYDFEDDKVEGELRRPDTGEEAEEEAEEEVGSAERPRRATTGAPAPPSPPPPAPIAAPEPASAPAPAARPKPPPTKEAERNAKKDKKKKAKKKRSDSDGSAVADGSQIGLDDLLGEGGGSRGRSARGDVGAADGKGLVGVAGGSKSGALGSRKGRGARSGGTRGPSSGKTEVARYPTVESPSRVPPGKTFAVQVSLTEDEITPEVVVRSGRTDDAGRLVLALPDDPDGWEIDVILSAPGFEVVGGGNTGVIRLPKHGDSTPAMFRLTADDVTAPTERKLYVTFWIAGAYLAKVVRPVLVAPQGARPRASPVSRGSSGAPTVTPSGVIVAPDLTVWMTRVVDPSRPDAITVLQINSPFLQPRSNTISHAPVSAQWLRSKYSRLAPKAARGVALAGSGSGGGSSAQTRIDRMVGFGRVVWDKLAPQAFRDAFWALRDLRGDKFRSLQIFTNDPALPWELMRPARTGRDGRTEELDFLGIILDVGRWHVVTRSHGQLDRPPQRFQWSKINVVAPSYPASQALSSQAIEVEGLRALKGFHAVPGNVDGMRRLIREGGGGIIHFAGHGDVVASPDGGASYAMRLEDDQLDLDTFRGMGGPRGPVGQRGHPLFFFNACDIGQADSSAGFVEGWAPAVLEKGAAGYVGGLWPLGDRGASQFATAFYGYLQTGLNADGEVRVATALRKARAAFYETADPTFLAYVFYGDPNLTFTR